MKRTITTTISAIAVMAGVYLLPVATAGAVDVFGGACGAAGDSSGGSEICGAATGGETAESIIKNVINLMLVILGMIAVIMIIIGGIRYATSNGDSNQITSAKNTVLYAVIGLIVAIFSFAIVNFVLDAFSGGGGGGANNGGGGPASTISPTQNPGSGTIPGGTQ